MLNRKRNSRREAPASGRRWWQPQWNWRRVNLRNLLWSVVGLAVVGVAAMLLGWLLNQPIQHITLTGRLQRVSPMEVEKAVRARLLSSGLVTVNLDDISRGVEQVPWVHTAAVKRSWPRGLTIQIVEQSAVARWNDAGLLNPSGELFKSDARFTPPELPLLSGPVGSEREVTARFLAMQGQLTEAGLRLVSLALDARGAWQFELDDGIEVRLGREQMDSRFERFMSVASKLVRARAMDIAYVDMRYGNGFAVGWKGAAGRGGAEPRTGDRDGNAAEDKLGTDKAKLNG